MLEAGRRSAISTSELGLYSDRIDRYNRSRHGPVVKKLAIGVMVVVTVILAVIFMYDFTSATSINSKINQETKHIYILQNALKKSPNHLSKKSANTTILSKAVIDRTDNVFSMEDRSDSANYEGAQQNATNDMTVESRVIKSDEAESRIQNLHNFKQRNRMLKSLKDSMENEEFEAKRLLDNHAIVYRIRQRYKYPDSDQDINTEAARPTPFHWEFKTPYPVSFKRPRYPQLSQYRYPHSSRNIQDIIKYLSNDGEMPNRGIKFTGVYVSPKKFDLIPGISDMMSANNDRSDEDETSSYPIVHNNDPFYRYKPKHPADVNLLATSNVRFSPTGIHRYSPYHESLYYRPLLNYNKPVVPESQYENVGSYSTNTFKSRKPKPFSVMLDIYPITDITEQNKNVPFFKQQGSTDDYESRKPFRFNRTPKFHLPSLQPSVSLVTSPTILPEQDEKQQMIFHLNLYPRRKNKLNRKDIIRRSESMGLEERQQFAKTIMSPLESITKRLTEHSANESGFEDNENSGTTSLPLTRNQEIVSGDKDERSEDLVSNNNSEAYPDPSSEDDSIEENATVPLNHKLNVDDDYASTEKYEIETQEVIEVTENNCAHCQNTTIIDDSRINANKSIDLSREIDTVEGFFQRFSDSFSRSN